MTAAAVAAPHRVRFCLSVRGTGPRGARANTPPSTGSRLHWLFPPCPGHSLSLLAPDPGASRRPVSSSGSGFGLHETGQRGLERVKGMATTPWPRPQAGRGSSGHEVRGSIYRGTGPVLGDSSQFAGGKEVGREVGAGSGSELDILGPTGPHVSAPLPHPLPPARHSDPQLGPHEPPVQRAFMASARAGPSRPVPGPTHHRLPQALLGVLPPRCPAPAPLPARQGGVSARAGQCPRSSSGGAGAAQRRVDKYGNACRSKTAAHSEEAAPGVRSGGTVRGGGRVVSGGKAWRGFQDLSRAPAPALGASVRAPPPGPHIQRPPPPPCLGSWSHHVHVQCTPRRHRNRTSVRAGPPQCRPVLTR